MSELDPRARKLIALAGAGEGPTAHERSRLHGKVLARVGIAVVGTASISATAATASATTAAAGGSVVASVAVTVAKILGVVMVVGGIGTAVGTSRYFAPLGHPRPSQLAHTSVPAPTTSGMGSARKDADVAISAKVPAKEPLPAAATTVDVPKPADRAVAAGIAPAATADPSFGIETRALREALSDLRDGNAERALTAINMQDARFPHGALAEERAEARIVALCTLDRTEEARGRASQFLRDYPRSLLAGRVETSCGGTRAP